MAGRQWAADRRFANLAFASSENSRGSRHFGVDSGSGTLLPAGTDWKEPRKSTSPVCWYGSLSLRWSGPLNPSSPTSSNGGTTFAVPAAALSGDLGGGVLPGRNKRIVWNAGTDWSNQLSDTVKFRVQAEVSLAFSLPDSSYWQSGYWPGTNYTAKSAFNRSYWNLGNYGNGWIQVDLGSQKEIHTVSFQTGQWPNGTTWHEFYLSDTPIGDNWVNLTAVASRSGWTEAYQPLSLSFPPVTGRFVLIVANSGPSWTDLGYIRINPSIGSAESSSIRVDTRGRNLVSLTVAPAPQAAPPPVPGGPEFAPPPPSNTIAAGGMSGPPRSGYTILPASGLGEGANYRRVEIQHADLLNGAYDDAFERHGYAHVWYEKTVRGEISDGFCYSNLLGSPFH